MKDPMQLTITHRDGPARRATLTLHDKTITTPTIIYPHTTHTPAPPYAPLTITTTTTTPPPTSPTLTLPPTLFSTHPHPNSYLIYPKDLPTSLHTHALTHTHNNNYLFIPPTPDILNSLPTTPGPLYIITNAHQLYTHQTHFTTFLTQLRQTLAPETTLYLPSIATPVNLSILAYLGIDLTDTTQATLAAHHHTLLFPTGPIPQDQLTELPCHCPACTHKHPQDLTTTDILTHNNHTFYTEAQHIRTAITRGTLRELVETRVHADPHATALLRLLDHNHPHYLEQATAITRKHPLLATTHEALFRPEVRRFQQRVLHRYHKPVTARILLLLPCAAHKPYFQSKSHAQYRAALLACPNPWIVHEVIVTSPLGLVPRELEIVPPASCYDITVTGHWDEDEKAMIQQLLRHYLATNHYDQIIVHLDTKLGEIVSHETPSAMLTSDGPPTSEASLQRLTEVLTELTAKYPRVSPGQRAVEEVEGVASFQFGPTLAHALMQDTTVRGRYPYRKIVKGSRQLGMITDTRGLISLTLDGAEAFHTVPGYEVTIADDFTLIGSVFAPGVVDSDPKIRIGDDVLILQQGRVCGVGVATMSGSEMKRARHGEAIKVRHRR